jgi:hypothetical protein
MTRDERYQHHYNLMVEWAEGRMSHWNAVVTECRNTEHMEQATAMCALADAAEVAKHAAVVMALAARIETKEET